MKQDILLKFAGILLLFVGQPALKAQILENTKVDAQINFIKKDRKVDMQVIIHFQAASDQSMAIGNFTRYYGGESSWNYLSSLDGMNGTVITKKLSADSLLIMPSNNEVNFTYTLSFDSAKLGDTYAPNVGENHVHLAFFQWMLPLADRKMILDYNIRINKMPDNWTTYNSINCESRNISFKNSLSGSFAKIIGAGLFYKKEYTLGGHPVKVFINNNFEIGNDRIADLVYTIVSYQRSLFSDLNFDFFSVALLPKEDNIAGIAISNMFLCYMKKDVTFMKLSWLLSHEIGHEWIGGKIQLQSSTKFLNRHQWFNEGTNDYFAYKVLLKSNLYSENDFVNSVNQYLKNIRENPYSRASEDSIIKLSAEGKYGVAAVKLQYYKGMLLGFIADHSPQKELNKSSNSPVDNFILKLVQDQGNLNNGTEITEEHFFHLSDSMNLPFKSLYQKHIIKGSTDFDLPQTLFQNRFHLEPVEYQVYDLGFSYSNSNRKTYAKSVDPAGPAYKGGLRDGMEIVSSNSNTRFGNAWCDCPIKIEAVLNGEQKRIEYMPRGKTVEVLQYVETR